MYTLISHLVPLLKKIIPSPIVRALRKPYHAALVSVMALAYGLPARKLTVIGVTGTKGKSTCADMLYAVYREAGYKTALISTIRFAINDRSEPNLFKMTLQGRGFVQAFMRRALSQGCTHLIVEITSESVLQYRHWFLDLDALIVTNIHPEHIESHGSFEKYVAAKRAIALTLAHSPKKRRILVTNADIAETAAFAQIPGVEAHLFSETEIAPVTTTARSVSFSYRDTPFVLPLPGVFNAVNALAVTKLAELHHIEPATSASALAHLAPVRGRTEHIDVGQDFLAIVDYAHTPDSLRALYTAFPTERKICVLGNTGGGRDTWKRPVMGAIADELCNEVILTNEDPYDEDPRAIVEAMASGMRRAPTIIMDRRAAITEALLRARSGDAVIVSGKGTDPYLMGPNGTKTPWSDAAVVRDLLSEQVANKQG